MFIDNIDKLQLSDEAVVKYSNELHSLRYLTGGLRFLYDQVEKIEIQVGERNPKGKRVFSFMNAPNLAGIPQDFVACAFHWYAVTICNYVKMVGWLAGDGDSVAARRYMERVLPEVHLWRNKVGAHFARIDPNKEDNVADLTLSVLYPIAYYDDAFYTPPITLSLSKNGEQVTNRQDMRWSLTHVHRDLTPRFWP